MKIGFFTNTYLPNQYGSTNSVQYFRRGLEKLGHEVYIFAPEFKGYKDKDKKVIRYPAFHWKYKIEYPIAFSCFSPVNMAMQRLGLDLIHCHQPFNLGRVGMRIARKLKLPLVFTNHCKYEEYTHYIPVPFQKYLKKYVINKATEFANNCDQIIAPSTSVKRTIIKRGVKKPIEILPTGIDWERFQKKNGSWIREKYGIKKDELLLLSVGRIEAEKNIDFLFDSVVEILKNNKKVKFMMVGEGSQKNKLINRAKEENLQNRIIFIGLINHQEIPQYYHSGDIFIHSSTSETQSMTINEAMAAGCSIVAIKASGVEDSVKDNFSGILTKNNKRDFISSINDLIRNPKRGLELSRNAREEAKKVDYLTQAEKVESLYRRLVVDKK